MDMNNFEVVYDYGAAYGVAPDGSLFRLPDADLPNTDPRAWVPLEDSGYSLQEHVGST